MAEAAPIHNATTLTRHIEARYHARHRQQLPGLVKLAEMVEDLHCDDDGVPKGLAGLLARMLGEMEVHMNKKELILFPAIRSGGSPGIDDPIAVMHAEHDSHAHEIARIRWLTHDMTVPEGACTCWATLYADLAEFIDDLSEHIRLENELLIPTVEASAGELSRTVPAFDQGTRTD